MRAEAVAASIRSIVEPLVARLAEQETIIRDQAETIGAVRAQLAAAEEWIHALEDLQRPIAPNLSVPTDDPPRAPSEPSAPPSPTRGPISSQPDGGAPWWRRWWRALGAGA